MGFLFNQDAHVVVDPFDGVDKTGYFAIYDGHGGRGAVDFVAKALHTVRIPLPKKKI